MTFEVKTSIHCFEQKGKRFERKIPHKLLERRTFRFSSYKNRELKMKLWWAEASKKKKSVLFLTFIPL